MLFYIEGCEDALNLAAVAYIEFRDAKGNIPMREDGKAIHITAIHQARVFFHGPKPIPDITYLETSARQLFDFVRRSQRVVRYGS